MNSYRKIPVIIVTGFLGAGKTTFINSLIHTHKHLKLALIENEFGEISIDSELIIGIDGGNIFELSNGCICCTITNEFSLALIELAEKFSQIDFLLIETTGIADLSKVIAPFYSDKELQSKYSLQGCICIVDAVNYNKLILFSEQQMQLIHSDLVVINKIAEITTDVLDGIERSITAFNSSAKMIQTNYSIIDGFRLENFEPEIQKRMEKRLAEPVMYRLIESPRFTTFTHQFEGLVDIEKFMYWFDYFAAINQLEIYRIKGILFVKGSITKTIVQSVGGVTSYTEGSIVLPSEEQKNTLVFIGKGVDFNRIVYELESYLFDDDKPSQ